MAQSNSAEPQQGGNKTLVIVLGAALVLALIAIAALAFIAFGKGSGSDEGVVAPPPGITVAPTQVVPTPAPGKPMAWVTAPGGVNVRTGPGPAYPVILTAQLGAKGEIVGVSPDKTWWVVSIPKAPGNVGWVAAEYVRAENTGNVPVVNPPPVPAPVVTPTPTATPAPSINFTASRTTINAGESVTLSWNVENVKAVYVFPVGASPFDYPAVGQGTRDVQPGITTTYELRVINPDDSTSSQRIEITVIGGLTGGRWLLTSYSTPAGGYQTPLPGSQVTARFSPDGSVTGSAGCNDYRGGFSAYERTLSTGELNVSRGICDTPPGIMEQESTFLTLMRQARSFAVSAGQLEVFDGGGNRILVFVAG